MLRVRRRSGRRQLAIDRRRARGPDSTPRCCCPTRFTRRCWPGAPASPSAGAIARDWRGRLLTRAVRRRRDCIRPTYYQHLVQRARISERTARAARSTCPTPRATRRRACLTDRRVGRRGAAGGARARRGVWRREALAAGVVSPRWPTRLPPTASRCVLVGSAGRRAAATEMLAGARAGATRSINLIGRTDLPALAGVLRHCRALVTNDSGAMHLAAALGVSVTACSARPTNAATRPLGDAHVGPDAPGLVPALHAARVPADHRCMRGISPRRRSLRAPARRDA